MAISSYINNFLLTLLIFLTFLICIAVYLENIFPKNLNNIQPQIFLSHPFRDLSSEAKGFNTLKYHHLNDPSIGNCEDFEIATNGQLYCVNLQSDLVQINLKINAIKKLYEVDKGCSYGNRLSKDQTKLYFINTELGLCQYDISSSKFTSLVSQFQSEKLLALNAIEIHPSNPNILYITQSTTKLPMYLHTIDILLNNPFGRLFQFNLKNRQLILLTEGLYFPNGVVYQIYQNEPTLLVAETNRLRVMRIYLQGSKKGMKQVAIDKLDLYIDNMKMTDSGDLWIAGPSIRDRLSSMADRIPLLRKILTRLPYQIFPLLLNTAYMGGIKVQFSNNNTEHQLNYYIYPSTAQFKFATTLIQNSNNLMMSSFSNKGFFIIELQNQGNKSQKNQEKEQL